MYLRFIFFSFFLSSLFSLQLVCVVLFIFSFFLFISPFCWLSFCCGRLLCLVCLLVGQNVVNSYIHTVLYCSINPVVSFGILSILSATHSWPFTVFQLPRVWARWRGFVRAFQGEFALLPPVPLLLVFLMILILLCLDSYKAEYTRREVYRSKDVLPIRKNLSNAYISLSQYYDKLSVPSARQCNFASKFSIWVAKEPDKSRNWDKFSYSACFSAIRDVRIWGGRNLEGGWFVEDAWGVVGSSIEGREYLFWTDIFPAVREIKVKEIEMKVKRMTRRVGD